MMYASAVPSTAPVTPRSAPGNVMPKSVHVGKMSSQLKSTSSRHISTFRMLGVCMSPLQRSMPEHSELSMEKGRHSEKYMK